MIVLRFPQAMTEQPIDEHPGVARLLRDVTLKSLAVAQGRLVLLGRMTAKERVAPFLLERPECNDDDNKADLPMSRCADYLGLTIETVCRVLSDLKRRGVIATSGHSVTWQTAWP